MERAIISKKYSKEFSETLTQREIISALQFVLIVFVLYPVVPSETIIALKKVGAERGLPIIGALGGLVLTNAVMLGRNLVIAVGMLYSYFLKPGKGSKDVQISLEPPFAIIPLKFAVLFSIISLAVNYLKNFGAGSTLGKLVSSLA